MDVIRTYSRLRPRVLDPSLVRRTRRLRDRQLTNIYSQIDRFAAIWQAAHPGAWAFTEEGRKILDGDSVPFCKSRGSTGTDDKFWTGNDAQSTLRYGNYYEDAYDPTGEKFQDASDVKKNFLNLYRWSIPWTGFLADLIDSHESMAPLDLTQAQVYLPPDGVPGGIGPVLGQAPQIVMSAMTSAAAAISNLAISSTTSRTFAAAPDDSLSQVDSKPVAPETSTGPVAFTNMPASATDVAPATVDESKYYRDWYIDNVVEA